MCRLRWNKSRRPTYGVICFAVAALTCRITIAEPLPYTASVVVPGAAVLSGPGDAYYPTDTLPEGSVVEVYRERADGWCAIRPPEASFSWVYGGHLTLLDGSLAEIDKSNVASRIGSRLSEKRNAVQVRLKKGEVVQLLGEEAVGGQTWYKIAPPAGEFRWIHASSIARAGSRHPADRDEPKILIVSATDGVADGDATSPSKVVGGSPDSAPRDHVEAPLSATADANLDSNEDWRQSAGAAVTDDGAAQQPQPVAAVDESLPRRLADVELRLSRMVAQPPAMWNIVVLEREAEQLLADAQTVADRENIKTTLAKLDRFAAIQRRYARANVNAPAPVTPVAPASPVAPGYVNQSPAAAPSGLIPLAQSGDVHPSLGPPGATTPDGTPYDAVGTLRPVVSKRPGAPQYALVDDRGQVVSFVTPTPDVNLQPYVGHRVGVVGNRGYIPEFHRAHVTAGRVAPLGEQMVR